MRIRHFICLTIIVFLLSGNVFAQAGQITLTIRNAGPVSICFVFFKPSEIEDWGEERLGLDTLRPGEQQQWQLAPGYYDLAFYDCDGQELLLTYGYEILQSITLEYPGVLSQDSSPPPASDVYARINSLSIQGNESYLAGQYDQAWAIYQEALSLAQTLENPQQELPALTLYSLDITGIGSLNKLVQQQMLNGLLARRAGRNAEAAASYEAALALFRGFQPLSQEAGAAQLIAELPVLENLALTEVGYVYLIQGQYGRALDAFTRALVNQQNVSGTTIQVTASEALILASIGQAYEAQGQYGEALKTYQAMAEKQAGFDIGAQFLIGSVYAKVGEFDLSRQAYESALRVTSIDDYFVEDNRIPVDSVDGLGMTYVALGRLDDALRIYTQLLERHRRFGDRAREGRALQRIGVVQSMQGQDDAALLSLTEAVDIARAANDRAGVASALNRRGAIYETRGQTAEATADYREAVDVIERVLNDAALDSTIISLMQQTENRSPYQRLVALLVRAGDIEGAFSVSERGRAVLGRTEIASDAIDFRAGVDAPLLQQEINLRFRVSDAQNHLNVLQQDPNAAGQALLDAQAELDAARAAYDGQLQTMQLQGGYLARQLVFDAASTAEVQAALPPDTTLLVYSIGDRESAAFVVTQAGLEGVPLSVTTDDVDAQVRLFAADRRANAGAALRALHDLVFAPVADKIRTAHLLIVPDGPLNYVPFAALQPPDGTALADRFAISMIPSAAILVLLKNRMPAAASSAALVLAQPEAPGKERLGHACAEAANIADLFGISANCEATEAQLRANVAGSGLLHISAHAELDAFAPLYSAIYLGAGDGHDGRLEVRELYELDLSATELVILSGCETGSGGDGENFGLLNRALFAAGAQQVVSSLWSVDDEATAALMTAFMEARQQGDSEAEALRAAMLSARATFPEPYFWASFVLTGLP